MMYRHHGCHGAHHCGYHGVMSVEEEVQMLEEVKEHLEAQMANVNERLAKLKE